MGPASFFDSAAGGSGHMVELFGNGRDWMNRAMELMFRDEEHHRNCITACQRCLLTTAGQFDYELGLLQRQSTYRVLRDILGEGSP